MADVVQVVADAFAQRRVAAQAVDLSVAGHAGFHLVPQHIAGNPLLKLVDELRPLRPWADQRHLPGQDVEQLRQLVEAGAAEKPAEPRAALVVGGGPNGAGLGFGVLPHGSELEHTEPAAVEPHADLLVEHRPGAGQLDHQSNDDHGDRPEQQAGQADDDIECPLEHRVPSIQRRLPKREDGHAVERADVWPHGIGGTDVGHHPHVGGAGLELREHIGDAMRLVGGQGDEDGIDRVLGDDFAEPTNRRANRQFAQLGARIGLEVIDEIRNLDAGPHVAA